MALRILYCLLLLCFSGLAWAHPMPSSEVKLRLNERNIGVEMRLPIIELKLGWQKPLSDSAEITVAQYGEELKGYVAEHLKATAPDGRAWTVRIDKVAPLEGTYPEVKLDLTLTPPTGAPVDRLTLNHDVILHQLVTHTAVVSLERDWRNGQLEGKSVLLGTLTDRDHTLTIDRSNGTLWKGFRATLLLGMHHIAEGTDHLLFLLALLLPVSLVARSGHWAEPDSPRNSVRKVIKIVTAFTVGHSLTLALGALGVVHLPARPIEIGIALSILVSAIHAARPLLLRREALLAGVFGLVHGLAFAETLTELGLGPKTLTLSLLGFNLGIELIQLCIVAVTVPWLLLLGRTRYYTPFRLGGAAVAGFAAVAWLLERVLGKPNGGVALVEALGRHAGWLLLALAAGSLLATWRTHRATLTPS